MDVALVTGAIATVLVPVVGLCIGHMATRQADRRLRQEHNADEARLAQEHRDEETRLKLDAAMRAATRGRSSRATR